MINKIPQHVMEIFNALHEKGKAFFVGGSVRDLLFGKPPNDWDLCTELLPDVVEKLFEKTTAKGKKFGTIVVETEKGNVEITTMRKEGVYQNSRYPTKISFTNKIEEDLPRRDFTINAIAFSPPNNFVNTCGGLQDAKNKILKSVGNADQKFQEDPLRILRALRFASCMDLKIESETKNAIQKNSTAINALKKNVIFCEMQKFSKGKNAKKIKKEFTSVFKIINAKLEV